jgi:hypothetical protein
MMIQANPDALVVYITIRQTTFYIDYSMEEPIVEMWKEKETEVITLTPETDVKSTED